MKINWKSRFHNKVTLTAIIAQVLAIVYMALSMAGITPAIGEETVMEFAMLIVGLFTLLGIVVDPNTPGVGDNTQK